MSSLIRNVVTKYEQDNSIRVSCREIECITWAARGKTTWETSIILNISVRTVRFHLDSFKNKVNANNIANAIYLAVSYDFIPSYLQDKLSKEYCDDTPYFKFSRKSIPLRILKRTGS